jgi:hypothetical protein
MTTRHPYEGLSITHHMRKYFIERHARRLIKKAIRGRHVQSAHMIGYPVAHQSKFEPAYVAGVILALALVVSVNVFCPDPEMQYVCTVAAK